MKKVSIVALTLSIGNGKGGSSNTTCDYCRQLPHGCAAGIKLHRWD